MVPGNADGLVEHALSAAFQESRSRMFGRAGMVAAGHPLAAQAGIDALRKGGTAMDAAIAAATTSAVVLPAMCGLGGDTFFLHCDGGSGEVTSVLGSGAAPRVLNRDYFTSRGYDQMPHNGPLSSSVPGTVAAWFEGIRRFCRLSPEELFATAIRYASEGFPLSDVGVQTIAASRDELRRWDESSRIFLRDGETPQPGDLLVNRDLATSLQTIVEGGPEVFYQGELGKRIVDSLRSAGGELSMADFEEHVSEVGASVSTRYRDWTVHQTGLPTQGIIVLEELNILSNADIAAFGHNSADAIHLMVEAKKRAFADRLAYARDPRFGPSPVSRMLSADFAAERFATIDMNVASNSVPAGSLGERSGDTTYLCAADGDGNMVSFIQSLFAGFGSHFVAGDTGIVLNNRAGRGFSLDPNHPNVIEGGKRTMHTLNCWALERDGRVQMVGGTPGGDQQPQWNMQILTNLIDHNLDPQEAVEAPRWMSFPGTDPSSLDHSFELSVESRVGDEVLESLRRRGHRLKILRPYGAGGAAFVIRRDPETGVLQGGGDPRCEGFPLAI